MTTVADRRKIFEESLSSKGILESCHTYASLLSDWNNAVALWQDKKKKSSVRSAESRIDEKSGSAPQESDELRKSFRARRHAEILMADEILKQAHDELDVLLRNSTFSDPKAAQQPASAAGGDESGATRKRSLSSFSETYLHTTKAPDDIRAFDGRLPQVVPAAFYSKAVDIVLSLDPSRATAEGNPGGSTTAKGVGSDSSAVDVVVERVRSSQAPRPSTPAHHGDRNGSGSTVRSQGVQHFLPASLQHVNREVLQQATQDLTYILDTMTTGHMTSTAFQCRAVLFQCRAACHLELGNTRLALRDSSSASEVEGSGSTSPNAILAHRRSVACHVLLFDIAEARATLQLLKASGYADWRQEARLVDELHNFQQCMANKLLPQALQHIRCLCEALPEAPMVEKHMEVLYQLDDPGALGELASATLKFPFHANLWYWYGLAQLRGSLSFEHVEDARRSLQRAVSLSGISGHVPASQELSKVRYFESKAAMATSYFKSKRWRQAVAELTILLTLQGTSRGLKLHFSKLRAQCFLALGRPAESFTDTTYLLNHCRDDVDLAAAYLLRAEGHLLAKDMDAAKSDAQRAAALVPRSPEVNAFLQRLADLCHEETHRSKCPESSRPPTPPPPPQSSSSSARRPSSAAGRRRTATRCDDDDDDDDDSRAAPPPPRPGSAVPRAPSVKPPAPIPPHYALLDLAVSASSTAITKAYRDAALRWHPDRWISSSEAKRQAAEDMFKKINTAYQVLSDSALRSTYDAEYGVSR